MLKVADRWDSFIWCFPVDEFRKENGRLTLFYVLNWICACPNMRWQFVFPRIITVAFLVEIPWNFWSSCFTPWTWLIRNFPMPIQDCPRFVFDVGSLISDIETLSLLNRSNYHCSIEAACNSLTIWFMDLPVVVSVWIWWHFAFHNKLFFVSHIQWVASTHAPLHLNVPKDSAVSLWCFKVTVLHKRIINNWQNM